MKPENLEKMKQVIKDELGVSDELAEFGAKVTDGVCDAGYSGSVRVCLFNYSNKHRVFEKGEKIAQIIFLPVITPDFEQVEEITGGERSDNGFGSTGRF